MHQHQTSIDLSGTGSLFSNAEFLIVNAVETALLGFYWCLLWVASGCPAELHKHVSHFHITSDVAVGLRLRCLV